MNLIKIQKSNNKRYRVYFLGIKIYSTKLPLLKQLKDYLKSYTINRRLGQCKYIHFMITEKFTESTIKFFNQNFNKDEHLIFCEKGSHLFDIPKIDNVIPLNSLTGIDLTKKNIQKIICHGLFSHQVIDWLYQHPEISREKAYWCIWGGDLYGTNGNSKMVCGTEKDISVRQNFKGYVGKIDEQNAIKILNLKNKKFYDALCPFPITKDMILNSSKKEHPYITIQVNHSCNKNTFEMLDILSKWKNKNIRIRTVLSYGDTIYCEEIKEKGKEIFGDKFSYLDKMLSPQEYTRYLSETDILILNQDRQQGFGNTVASLNLGTKIFIKSTVSTFPYLNQIQKIKIYDTWKIPQMSFEEFIAYPEKKENLKQAAIFYDENELIKSWQEVLNDN